jgi:dCMP deaminase
VPHEITDTSVSCLTKVQLHETPCWSSFSARQSSHRHRVSWNVEAIDIKHLSDRYNGTARGLINCNEGGCPECNKTITPVDMPSECVCLHAEENALLEAGRERIGQDAVLYCNT